MTRCNHGGRDCPHMAVHRLPLREQDIDRPATRGDFWKALAVAVLWMVAIYLVMLVGAAAMIPVPR